MGPDLGTRRSPSGSGGRSFVEEEKFACLGLSAALTGLSEVPRSIEIAESPTPIGSSPKRLRQLVIDRVSDLRATFPGDPTGIRNALKELLRGRRMTVGPDSERGFKVEGLFEWPLQTQVARLHEETGRLDSVVAGTGFEPATSGL